MTNLLKSYDKFSIETELDVKTAVQHFKSAIYIDEGLFHSHFKTTKFLTKPFYGVFSYPNKFVIKSRFGFYPKTETEIDINKTDNTVIEFKENNSSIKLFIIVMSLPFIGLFLYFNLDSKFKIDFLTSVIILLFPIVILLVGSIAINLSSKYKKEYFKKLIKNINKNVAQAAYK